MGFNYIKMSYNKSPLLYIGNVYICVFIAIFCESYTYSEKRKRPLRDVLQRINPWVSPTIL